MTGYIPLLLILLAIDSLCVIIFTYLKKWKLLAAGVVLGAILDLAIVYLHNNP